MEDYREEFLKKFKNSLVANGITDAGTIVNSLVLSLEEYELSPRCTAVALRDESSEKIAMLYLASIKTEGKRDRTVKEYASVIRRFISEIQKPITEVGTMEIRIWLAKVQQKASMRTCENYRAYLSAFFIWMRKEGIIDSNPMDRISPIKYVEEDKKPFSDIDIDKIRFGCTSNKQRALIEVMLSSGLRVSELCDLKASDVNFFTSEIFVRDGKGGKQRKTYMNALCEEHLKKYLEERKHDSEYLFTDRFGNKMTVNSVEQVLTRLEKRCGVADVHPHRFRRTFASNMAKKGMDVRTIQLLLGHSNINTTMIYVQLSDEYVANEYRRFA